MCDRGPGRLAPSDTRENRMPYIEVSAPQTVTLDADRSLPMFYRMRSTSRMR